MTTENTFFAWLKAGIATRSLTLNAARSLAHLVDGKLFLVSPGIFKQYHKETSGDAGDKWAQTQKDFQKLKLHLRGEDGINIWNCIVKGPRSTRTLRGYLLSDTATKELMESALIADNPFLRLEITLIQKTPGICPGKTITSVTPE
ncbi:MAG: DNA-binding domain-containing protein [Hafnia sp.]